MKKYFSILISTLVAFSLISIAAQAFSPPPSLKPKLDALLEAKEQGIFEGFDDRSMGSYSIPAPHIGPYDAIEALNVEMTEGPHKGKDVSIFVGKHHDADKWEVFSIMVKESHGWVSLKNTRNKSS